MGLVGIFIFSLIISDSQPDHASATTTPVTSEVTYEDYYLSMTNSDNIDLDVGVTASGAYAYATDDLTIRTNVDGGYDLYLASSSTTSAALTTTSGNTTIATTSGTGGSTGTPATLTANSYGYAPPSSLIGNNNFDASYAEPSASSKWAAIPVATSESSGDLIRSTNEQNTAGDHIDVHYGVFANNALVAGEYTGSVRYTAVVTAATAVTASISPNSGSTAQTVTVTSGPLVANTTALSTSDVSIKFQQNNVDINTCTVTNVDTSNGYLVTTCTAPQLTGGSYDVAISVPRYNFTDTIANGYTSIVYYMQDASAATFCNNATNNTTVNMIDSRDNTTYQVIKLSSGCWMKENLKLTGSRTLTSADSDVFWNFTLPSSSSGWATTDYDESDLGIDNEGDCHNAGGSWEYDDYAYDQAHEVWEELQYDCEYDGYEYGHSGSCDEEEPEEEDFMHCIKESETYNDMLEPHLYDNNTNGVYYNWYTATAGTGYGLENTDVYYELSECHTYQPGHEGDDEYCAKTYREYYVSIFTDCAAYLNNDSALISCLESEYEDSSYNHNSSVCPKNWKLPQISALYSVRTSISLSKTGRYWNGDVDDASGIYAAGYWWSSTYDDYNADPSHRSSYDDLLYPDPEAYFEVNFLELGSNNSWYYATPNNGYTGMSIRCQLPSN